ncbi:hypothetical protein OSTOST_17994, partial [Ostertagia ostertagi]
MDKIYGKMYIMSINCGGEYIEESVLQGQGDLDGPEKINTSHSSRGPSTAASRGAELEISAFERRTVSGSVVICPYIKAPQ